MDMEFGFFMNLQLVDARTLNRVQWALESC